METKKNRDRKPVATSTGSSKPWSEFTKRLIRQLRKMACHLGVKNHTKEESKAGAYNASARELPEIIMNDMTISTPELWSIVSACQTRIKRKANYLRICVDAAKEELILTRGHYNNTDKPGEL